MPIELKKRDKQDEFTAANSCSNQILIINIPFILSSLSLLENTKSPRTRMTLMILNSISLQEKDDYGRNISKPTVYISRRV